MKTAFRSLALTALAAVLLSGCMVGPDYVRPELPLPARFAASADGQPQVAVARGWWKLFNDDTLNTLVDRALTDLDALRRAAAAAPRSRGCLWVLGRVGVLIPRSCAAWVRVSSVAASRARFRLS